MASSPSVFHSCDCVSSSMSPCWSVYFAGSQQVKWALDEDLRWAQRALGREIVEGSLAESRIIHSAWWPSAWVLGKRSLVGKEVVCFVDNPPSLYARQPEFLLVAPWIRTWIARSQRAIREFKLLGYRANYAPYCADPEIFKRLDPGHPDKAKLRRQLGIPADVYLVGNFHRDSEFSKGIAQAKMQKGPDIFLEIVKRAHATNPRVQVLLAGPRRHWLRRRLREEGVPVYYYGASESEHDDFSTNIVDRNTLNVLYNLLDVCLISSRWEGGPHSVLEAAFSRTKILSTPVGIAEDILESPSLFETIDEGVARLLQDVEENRLGTTVEAQFEYVKTHNQLEHLRQALLKIYGQFASDRPLRGLSHWIAQSRIFADCVRRRLFQQSPVWPKVIGFIGEDLELMLLEEAVRAQGIKTIRNTIHSACRHYVVSPVGMRDNILKAVGELRGSIILGWRYNAFGARAVLMPSLNMLEASQEKECRISHPVILPPIRSMNTVKPSERIVETLSIVPEDAVKVLLRTFGVLEFPHRIQWSGFL